ncbi:MAG: hypothetical protein H0T51_23645 [Pirellulales bacterium]|nr:hypothetical protein [Pirellulales bacterium]
MRDGFAVSTICSDDEVLRALQSALTYTRKVYQHPTWERRKAGLFDKIENEEIRCYQYINDPSGVVARQFVFAAGYLQRVAACLRQLGRGMRVLTHRRCGQPAGQTTSVFDEPQWGRLKDFDFRWMQRESIEKLCSKEYVYNLQTTHPIVSGRHERPGRDCLRFREVVA